MDNHSFSIKYIFYKINDKKGNNISLQELELKIYHNMKKQEKGLNKNIITLDKFFKITIIKNHYIILNYLLI